jgi:serine/threonine protein kinase
VSDGGTTSTSYEIVGRLAGGDVAELFLARSKDASGIERMVVVKRIPRAATQNVELARAFVEEARAAARLSHANVAHTHEVGRLAGSYFFASELVNGETLRALVEHAKTKKVQVPIRSVLTIAAGAAEALHHAHERRGLDGKPLDLVHGEISPTNVIVSREGIVKVTDFGIAKVRARAHTQPPLAKVSYWSPEQCRGEALDRRSDLFSLGVVLWELLTLEELYNRGGDARTRAAIENEPPVPPSTRRYDVPPELDVIIRRLIEKAAGERYQTAGELLAALENLASKLNAQLSTSELARMMRLWFGNIGEPVVPARDNPLVLRCEPIPADVGSPPADPADEKLATVGDATALLRTTSTAAAPQREDKITLVPGDTTKETRENFEQIRDRILAQARRKKETTKQAAVAAATTPAATPPTGTPNVGTMPPPSNADASAPRTKRETLNSSNNAYSFITNVAGKAAEPVRRLTSTPPSGTGATATPEVNTTTVDEQAKDASNAILAATAAAAKANAARLDAKTDAAKEEEALAARVAAAKAAAEAKAEEAAKADEEARAAAARAAKADETRQSGSRPVVVVDEKSVEAAKEASATLELEKLKTTGTYEIPPETVLRDAEAKAAETEKAAAAKQAADKAAADKAAETAAAEPKADVAASPTAKTDAKAAAKTDAADTREAPAASRAVATEAPSMAAADEDDEQPLAPRRPAWIIPAAATVAVGMLITVIVVARGGKKDKTTRPNNQQVAVTADARIEQPMATPDAAIAAVVTPDAAEQATVVAVDAAVVAVAPPDAAAPPPPDAAVVAIKEPDRPKNPDTAKDPDRPKNPDTNKNPDRPKNPDTNKNPDTTKTPDTPKEAEKTIEELVAAADFAKANKACKTNTIFNSGRLTACTIAACNVKDVALAKRWVRAISKAERPELIKTCATLGVQIEEAPPATPPAAPAP